MEKRTSSSVSLKSKAAPFFIFFFFFFFLFFFSFCALMISFITSTATCLGIRCPFPSQSDFYLQDFERRKVRESRRAVSMFNERRILSRPGSSPPRCTSKCGNCTPCKPVHVPVPPGTPVTAEYYPEAWRCKCGNKLYMP